MFVVVCFGFVLNMYFSLPQSFVLFDVLSVAVFVTRDRFLLFLNLYPCVIKYYFILSSSVFCLFVFLNHFFFFHFFFFFFSFSHFLVQSP